MSYVDVRVFLPHLKKSKESSIGGVVAVKSCCPYHEDDTPSFAVLANGGFFCQGCGEKGHANQLCDHLGIPHVVDDDGGEVKPREQWLETDYKYKDARGKLVGVVERYRCLDGSKKTMPKTVVGSELVWGKKVDFPLYKSELLAKSSSMDPVWFVEGEKCVDAMHERGLLAVTNQGGSKAFSKTDKDSLMLLNGRTVIIVPDNDGPGEALADQVLAECRLRGCAASIVRLPGLNDGEDCVEWFAAGNTADDLKRLAESSVQQSRDQAEFSRMARKYAAAVDSGADLGGARVALMQSIARLGAVATPHSMTAAEAFEELAKRIENGDEHNGFNWGIDAVDRLCGSLKRKKLVALAGDSGCGKTAWALQVADAVVQHGHAVRVYSQEMEATENVGRIAARRFGRPVSTLTAWEVRDLRDRYVNLPLSIYDRRVDLDFLVNDIRLWATQQEDPGLVIIDFIQLMDGRRGQQEHEMIKEVAYALKDLAKELNIAIIALGQLTLDSRRGGTPLTKASVRGGGSLADASDLFFLLEVTGVDGDVTRITCKLDKFRNGRKGEAQLDFDGPRFEFRDRTPSKILDVRDIDSYDEWAESFEYFDPVSS